MPGGCWRGNKSFLLCGCLHHNCIHHTPPWVPPRFSLLSPSPLGLRDFPASTLDADVSLFMAGNALVEIPKRLRGTIPIQESPHAHVGGVSSAVVLNLILILSFFLFPISYHTTNWQLLFSHANFKFVFGQIILPISSYFLRWSK